MREDAARLWAEEFGPEAVDDEVVAGLHQLAQQARARYPVVVSPSVYVPRWAAALRHVRSKDPDASLDSVSTDDVYLVAGVSAGVAGAVDCYRALCRPDLERVLRRLLPEPERAEMRQELEARLLVGDGSRPAALDRYRGSGGVRAWTRAVATRAVIDARRKRARRPEWVQWASARDPESDGDEELRVALGEHVVTVRAAMEQAFAQLTVRQRNVIRHSLFHGLSIDELGALYGVHRATVARWLQRARTDLSRHMESGFAEEVGASSAEAASLLRALRSRVDVSIRSFLASALETEPDDGD